MTRSGASTARNLSTTSVAVSSSRSQSGWKYETTNCLKSELSEPHTSSSSTGVCTYPRCAFIGTSVHTLRGMSVRSSRCGSGRTSVMVQPGPDPDRYPPIDPDEPVPDYPGELSLDTPETLPAAP